MSLISFYSQSIRSAIASSFKTEEIIKMFGAQDSGDLGQKLVTLAEEYRLKKINLNEMEIRKSEILMKLLEQGHSLSVNDQQFLDRRSQQDLQQLEQILDE